MYDHVTLNAIAMLVDWEAVGCGIEEDGMDESGGRSDRAELVLVRVEEVVQIVHGDRQVVFVDQAGRGSTAGGSGTLTI